MKMTVWDRIWSALSGVLIILAALWLLGLVLVAQPTWLEEAWMSAPLTWWQRAVMIVGALALMALGLHDILLLFRRGREKGFIIQHSEYGDMSISMKALESMVQKCVASHQELTVNLTRIQHAREGIVVDIRITLLGGVNIPLTVNALQKQIKQYITSCSGVDVYKVRVMVETDARSASGTEAQPAAEAPILAAAAPLADGIEEPILRHAQEPASQAVSAEELTEDAQETAQHPAVTSGASAMDQEKEEAVTDALQAQTGADSVEEEENA